MPHHNEKLRALGARIHRINSAAAPKDDTQEFNTFNAG
jgi:hypothetical protein